MRQIYYVNGKRVSFERYLAAGAYNDRMQMEADLQKVKIEAFIRYVEKNPSCISKWEGPFFNHEKAVEMAFNEWLSSDDCTQTVRAYHNKQKMKGLGCVVIVVIAIVLFVLRAIGVI